MLGDTVRETRIKKNLTQAKLARLAGVSRRHLAALEKGANVSVLVLTKVASVLDLQEIQLGDDLSLRASKSGNQNLNVAVIADAIREARSDSLRAETLLQHAEDMLTGKGNRMLATVRFPKLPVRRIRPSALRAATIRDRAGWLEVKTGGELRQGRPIDESKS